MEGTCDLRGAGEFYFAGMLLMLADRLATWYFRGDVRNLRAPKTKSGVKASSEVDFLKVKAGDPGPGCWETGSPSGT